jgi:hypothetical protein
LHDEVGAYQSTALSEPDRFGNRQPAPGEPFENAVLLLPVRPIEWTRFCGPSQDEFNRTAFSGARNEPHLLPIADGTSLDGGTHTRWIEVFAEERCDEFGGQIVAHSLVSGFKEL